MSSQHSTLVVVGSGPGIGVHVAQLFVERGFRNIVLMSRNAKRLATEVEQVKKAGSGVIVHAVTVDLANKGSISTALEQVEKHLGDHPLEAVLFNAARVGASKLFEFTPAEIENDFHISNVSLYIISEWALPKLQETAKTTSARSALLVTGGGLFRNPFPERFSLAMNKAAQHNFVFSLWKAYTPLNVHCGVVVVEGFVNDSSEVTTPRNVALKTWELYAQEKGEGKGWNHEIYIQDPAYRQRMNEENVRP